MPCAVEDMNDNSPEPDFVKQRISILSSSPEMTEKFAIDLAGRLTWRDTVCLEGPLGAGKSVFARSLIKSLLRDPDIPVPSPSYTLANVFSTADNHEIWHADLYRISDPEEIIEIGLQDAAGQALLVVEWGERWPHCAEMAITVRFTITDETTRLIEVEWPGSDEAENQAK